jgi:hypothetical protein
MTRDPVSGGDQPPGELEELNGLLRRVRFNPRASLEPELLGRMQRGEHPSQAPSLGRRRNRHRSLVLAGTAAILAAIVVFAPDEPVTIDHCCYDLDGGGELDDGVRVVAKRDGRVSRLSIYEDVDRTRAHSAGDITRLDRIGLPLLEETTPAGLTTTRHCCQDLDGGGVPDDALVVLGWPPDRVFTAAIYELR